MPLEEAAPQPAASPAAVVQPAAPPAGKGETFFQKMDRLGGFDEPKPTQMPAADPNKPPEPAASAEPEAAKPEPKPEKSPKGKKAEKGKGADKPGEPPPVVEAVAPTPEQKAEALKALAKDLGMTIEDGNVLSSDRAALRIAKREHAQRIEAQERELVGRYNEAVSNIQPHLDRANAVLKALDEGDADELAKLAGAKDWNEAQERFIAKMTDPNWKKIRDLERTVAEKERIELEEKQRLAQQSEHNAKIQAQRKYRAELSEGMKSSSDPVCREMAQDPAFVHAIFQIMQENWDGATTVTPEQALKMMVRGASVSVQDELKQHYERLHKVFGQAPVPAAAAEPAAPAKAPDRPGARPRPKTGVVPTATGGAPSPPGKFANAAERRAYNLSRLNEAAAADRRAG